MTIKQLSLIMLSFAYTTPTISIEFTEKLNNDLNSAKNNAERHLDQLYSNQAKNENVFWINQQTESIKDPLWKVKAFHPSLSDKDLQELASTFSTKLQIASQEKALAQVEYYIKKGLFQDAAETINMHNRLCKNFIKSPTCDCAAIHQDFKQTLNKALKKEHERLEEEIENAPNKLQQTIERAKKDSEWHVARDKQEQKNLDKAWQSID
jgi:hypothetical protein